MKSQSLNSLEQWLTRIESFHPKEIDLGLNRIQIVAESLQCTQFDCPVITVAGTNGKGSTVETLKQLALVKNLKVGTYTSPHLFEFNERISINGNYVSDQELILAFEQIENARCQNANEVIPLSFFEFTTLAALIIFKKAKLDLIVLEVGLGGRLDAVNIVDANLAIITSIGIDHEAWLGNTRELIAIEKAGVARKNRICIIGDVNPPANLKPHLLRLGANCLQVGEDFYFSSKKNALEIFLADCQSKQNKKLSFLMPSETLKLAPENCILALQAFVCLGWQLTQQEMQQALSQTQILGRFQVFDLALQGKVICDLTHNPAGAEFFLKQLTQYFATQQVTSISILLGVMADKDIEGVLKVFLPLGNTWLLCNMASERAAKATDIQKILNNLQNDFVSVNQQNNCVAKSQTFNSIQLGIEHYLHTAKPNDYLLVIGSFFSVGPAIKLLAK